MASRKRGSNNRKPREHQRSEPCISIMPNGEASMFKPKRKPRHTTIEQDARGKYFIQTKERALR